MLTDIFASKSPLPADGPVLPEALGIRMGEPFPEGLFGECIRKVGDLLDTPENIKRAKEFITWEIEPADPLSVMGFGECHVTCRRDTRAVTDLWLSRGWSTKQKFQVCCDRIRELFTLWYGRVHDVPQEKERRTRNRSEDRAVYHHLCYWVFERPLPDGCSARISVHAGMRRERRLELLGHVYNPGSYNLDIFFVLREICPPGKNGTPET